MKNHASLKEVQRDLFSNKTSCVKIVREFIHNISEKQHLNAFVEVFSDTALIKAKEVDDKIKNKNQGKLAGLVVGIKDNICYAKHTCTASSKILEGFISPYSSTVVDRLISEDAIIIGRLNCDEFAMGSSNENSYYGPVKNPINESYVSGGSSGGSASAVSANLCHLALGSDTGGSVRQPSAFCNLFGLKPTYGLVSRHGLISYASSFDQIGPIAKSIHDINTVMDVISGSDDFDNTCVGSPFGEQKISSQKRKRFAVLKDALEFNDLDSRIKKQFENFVKSLESSGHEINYISLPMLEYLVPCYYILTTAEASSNLARYDGIRFGFQSQDQCISSTRSLGFGNEVKRRILLGTYVLSEGYYDAYYIKAQKVRNLLQQSIKKILLKNDFIILPTTPNLPFKIGKKPVNPVKRYIEDIFTVQANLSGHPSFSFPYGDCIENGFKASIQIIGDFFKEREILNTVKNVL